MLYIVVLHKIILVCGLRSHDKCVESVVRYCAGAKAHSVLFRHVNRITDFFQTKQILTAKVILAFAGLGQKFVKSMGLMNKTTAVLNAITHCSLVNIY